MMRIAPLWTVALVCGISPTAFGAPISFGPSPYLSFAGDSPFASALAAGDFDYFFLEDFEDGLANTPGLILPAGHSVALGVAAPHGGTFIDSVQEDFGPGDGFVGGSLFVGHNVTGLPVLISFDAGVLGKLPTHVGLVVTDLQVFGQLDFMEPVTLEAFGPGGVSLGTVTDPNFGNSTTFGGTDEDRFLGFFSDAGIESISITSPSLVQLELDHIQYGGVVPEPSSFILVCIGAIGFAVYRRRHKLKHVA